MENSSRKENTPTTIAESSAPSTTQLLHKESFLRRRTRRFSSVIRRVNNEWNCFVLKLKSATHFSYSDEEALDSLFESSDEDFFERAPRSRKCCKYSAAELKFMDDLKSHNSLERYYEENRDETPEAEDMPSNSNTSHTKLYHALDVSRLRDKYEVDGQSGISSGASEDEVHLTNKEALLKERIYSAEKNLGTALWEIRRARWLTPDECDDVEEKVRQRASEQSIKHIPRDMFPRIYREFVEKAKPLKPGKYINLEDMIAVINSGWVHDKVWDSASKGLPS
ncbi:hypothetical protein JCM33374_g3187 [Metschnikowia sp. JCM 33374]|nr:hypothetical protein JCM33374_g3187 [Metschnikowia sp. JCM 33374]